MRLIPTIKWGSCRRIVLLGLLSIQLTVSIYAQITPPKTGTLRADELHYTQSQQLLTASGNVELNINNTTIKTDTLWIDTHQNLAWSSGNIEVKPNASEDNHFYTTKLLIDLDKQQLYLYNLDLKIRPLDSSRDLFMKSGELAQGESKIRGKNGLITSCELPHPHYYIKASSYAMTPDHYIMGTNVFFYIPIWKIPFGLYSPLYVYQIGDRQLIWNFPTIGKKSTPGWGWFAQNTIDYNHINGEDSSVFLDVFTQDDFKFHEKATGLGIRHQYSILDQPGTLYFYNLNIIDEPGLNQKKEWIQTLTFSRTLSARLQYTDVNAIRINSSGRTQTLQKSIQLTHDDLGDTDTFSYNEAENALSKTKSTRTTYTRNYESDHHKIDIDMTQNESSRLKTNRTNSTTKTVLPGQINVEERLNFLEKTADGIEYVQSLDSQLTLSKQLNRTKITLNVNQLIDTRAGTSNIPVSRQNEAEQNYTYFYKLPELNIHYQNPKLGPFNYTSDTTIARYKEVLAIDPISTTTPKSETIEPNTYIFKNSLSQTWSDLALDSDISFKLGYDQYLFKNEGADLFEGDAMYAVYFSPKLTTHLSRYIQSETSFDWKGVGKDSNSPFLEFQNQTRGETNLINQSIVFLDPISQRFNWAHTAGYNYISDKWTSYSTSLRLKPTTAFETQLSTNRDLERGIWSQLNTQTILKQKKSTSRLTLNRDIEKGEIRYSAITTQFTLGTQKDYEWAFDLTFNYDTITGQNRTIQLDKYILNEIRFVKSDHCRNYTFSYNKTLDQWSFKYTILAYPKDSFGIRKDKDVTQFEGIFDEKSQERL